MTITREVEKIPKKEDNLNKKKRGEVLISKLKRAPKKKAKIYEIGSGDSQGEQENLIKERDFDIETLIAICGEME